MIGMIDMHDQHLKENDQLKQGYRPTKNLDFAVGL